MVATAQAGLRRGMDPGQVDVPATVRPRVRHGCTPAAAERRRPGGTPLGAIAQPAVAGRVEVDRPARRPPRRAQEEATSAPPVPVLPPTEGGPASALWLAVERTPACIAGILRCASLAVGQVPHPARKPPSTPSPWSSARQAEEAAAAASGWMPDIIPLHRLMPAAGARRRIDVTGGEFRAGTALRDRHRPRGPAPRGRLANGARRGMPRPAAQSGGPRR